MGAGELLDGLRALSASDRVLNELTSRAVREAWLRGVPRHQIAAALGISRATLYRRFGSVCDGDQAL